MSEALTVDELTFEIRRSARRNTLELTVDRGGELRIAAPPEVGHDVIADFVREKRFWLYTKLAEKASRRQPVAAKEFVSGEGFPYLGRSYRLLLVDAQGVPLKLEAGRFKLLRSAAPDGRDHFVRWYTEHARPWLHKLAERFAARVGVEPAGVEVRDLGFRWGSCGATGTLNFHWVTILLPSPIAEYVVVHELVHLKEPNHTPEFWRRLERAMPDWEARKAWLAERGAGYVGL